VTTNSNGNLMPGETSTTLKGNKKEGKTFPSTVLHYKVFKSSITTRICRRLCSVLFYFRLCYHLRL